VRFKLSLVNSCEFRSRLNSEVRQSTYVSLKSLARTRLLFGILVDLPNTNSCGVNFVLSRLCYKRRSLTSSVHPTRDLKRFWEDVTPLRSRSEESESRISKGLGSL